MGLLAIACVGAYIAGAPRGIELTDEAFYALHFRYWERLNFNFSFFGAYLDGLFLLLQERIEAMRVAGALLVMGASAVLFRQLAAYVCWRCPELGMVPRRLVVVAAVLGLVHYLFMWTLRLPSYNTIAFVGCAVTSALLLDWIRSPRRRAWVGFLYGLAIGLTVLGKVTAGILLVLLHLGVLLVHLTWLSWRDVMKLVVAGLAGVALNLAYLTLRQPGWWQVVLDGLVFQRTMETRDLLLSLRAVLWSWQREAPLTWLCGMAVMLGAQLLMLWRRISGAWMLALGTLAMLCLWMFGTTDDRGAWLLLTMVAGLSLSAQLAFATGRRGLQPFLLLAFLVLGLPLVYSFGTNAALAEHSLMAGTFPLLALLCGLWMLRAAGQLSDGVLALGAGLLLLPALAAVMWPWLHAEQTYRLGAPLALATETLPDNPRYRGLRTDARTAQALTSLEQVLAAQGFRSGQPIVELTGGHPGLVDLLGGEPVGVAWLLGGYPGSAAAAGVVIDRVDPERWRGAWLLTSRDAVRRIAGWEAMLARRLNGRCHDRVATLKFSPPSPASRSGSDAPIELSVWRPSASCEAGGSYGH